MKECTFTKPVNVCSKTTVSKFNTIYKQISICGWLTKLNKTSIIISAKLTLHLYEEEKRTTFSMRLTGAGITLVLQCICLHCCEICSTLGGFPDSTQTTHQGKTLNKRFHPTCSQGLLNADADTMQVTWE